MILDLFSGVHGWTVLMPELKVVGVEKDLHASHTARANRRITMTQDVRETSSRLNLAGLIASPPCPRFSSAGKGEGREEIPLLIECLNMMASTTKYKLPSLHPDSALTLEPMRFILDGEPDWIAMEQVPSVLPIWDAYANILRTKGYQTDVGILSAERYGLGTARKRAFIIASRSRSVQLPRPEYSSFNAWRPENVDPNLPRWRSMADVLGWGMTSRPAPTVTAGGTSTGGPEPFGSGTRQRLLKEFKEGRWTGPLQVRPTVLDLRLLQSFPDDFVFTGGKTSVVRQIGNSVPPVIGKKVLECVI